MLIDAHAHLDRYDLLGEHALESALAEIADPRLADSYGKKLEEDAEFGV